MRTRHLASLTLALTLGAASLAAAQSTTTPAATEAVQAAQVTAVAAADSRPRHRHRHRHHRRHARLFRGVHLTTDQRAKLSTIRDQYRTQSRVLFHQIRTARHAARAATARTDTAAVSAARATMRDAHAKFASLRTQWKSDARGVLTPDQQTQFDKNAARGRS
jgi:Spy/CpxP family protein refolding chaperone